MKTVFVKNPEDKESLKDLEKIQAAQAFPQRVGIGEVNYCAGGLSKREFFAAMALVGCGNSGMNVGLIVERAIYCADSLVKELAKEKK